VGHDFSDIRLVSDDAGFVTDDSGFIADNVGFGADDPGFVSDDADLVADDRGLVSDDADDLQLGPEDIDGPADDRVPDDFDLATTDGPALLTETAGLSETETAGLSETDGDSHSGATEIDEALLDGIERELADVELALARLGDGTYGRCESCGLVLSDEELEAAPTGRFCRAHLPLDLS
jgi:RNA polymerase-binding transcription factor DksA